MANVPPPTTLPPGMEPKRKVLSETLPRAEIPVGLSRQAAFVPPPPTVPPIAPKANPVDPDGTYCAVVEGVAYPLSVYIKQHEVPAKIESIEFCKDVTHKLKGALPKHPLEVSHDPGPVRPPDIRPRADTSVEISPKTVR